jgi:hypothetical protein
MTDRILFGELTFGRIGPTDREREQTFFGQSPKIRFPRLTPPCTAVMSLILLVLAIAPICPALAQEELTTGKSAGNERNAG